LLSPIYLQGTSTTGDCCSKCFNELQKKKGAVAASSPVKMAAAEPKQPEPMQQPAEAMDVDEPMVKEQQQSAVEPASVKPAAEQPKTKGKKTSYKNMLKDMMKAAPERDIEREKEQLRRVTGGGEFRKIDKI
jgi:hypothetical protein